MKTNIVVLRLVSIDQNFDCFNCMTGNLFNWLSNRCKGRIDDLRKRDVIHAYNRNIIRDRDIIISACFIDAIGDHIIKGKNSTDIVSKQTGKRFAAAVGRQRIAE